MLYVLLILWGGIAIGYLLHHWPQRWVGHVLTLTIRFLLFFVGVEVGANEVLVGSLVQLGGEALMLAFLTMISCSLGALGLWRKMHPQNLSLSCNVVQDVGLSGVWHTLTDSLVIFVSFAIGCVAGYWGLGQYIPAQASSYTLYLLLACVGFGVGQSSAIRSGLRKFSRQLMLLPIVTILGTWVGALVMSVLFGHRTLSDWLAVSSGFGYYSLSSILISEARSVELGTIALVYNVLREITTLLFAPLLFRFFGPLAPITIGGATTADTTLPVISRVCGMQFVPIAIFHGLLVDLSVPFFVSLFCSL